MKASAEDFQAIRRAIAAIPGDLSSDAVGAHAARLDEIYAPEGHAAALDPLIPIVLGARGTGKSFWAGVLDQAETRAAAALAYPRLGLDRLEVRVGFAGIPAPGHLAVDAVEKAVPSGAGHAEAKIFWWATILRAVLAEGGGNRRMADLLALAADWEERGRVLSECEDQLRYRGKVLLVVYDALDRLGRDWPRRRLLTESLLEVAWEMRAFRFLRIKLFFRPDQIEDEALRFVELPKLRTGAVRLKWSQIDLYGLVFARLALTADPDAQRAFAALLRNRGIALDGREQILRRHWVLSRQREPQERIMTDLAGPYMGAGALAFRKGKTYDWPFRHLADAFGEVTPRSFLGLLIAAAQVGLPPEGRVLTPEGLRHGLRAASKTRVDQLHLDFAWIKGVLAPLAGLLLPQEESKVFAVWKAAGTLDSLTADARANKYLPPFPLDEPLSERDLYIALEKIGVMARRKDDRLDMPDLFRVAARLLKKGATAPLK